MRPERMHLDITISKRLHFTSDGMPDYETYEIQAMVLTDGEEDSFGGISLESPSQVVQLYNTLGNYIRAYDLDHDGMLERFIEDIEADQEEEQENPSAG